MAPPSPAPAQGQSIAVQGTGPFDDDQVGDDSSYDSSNDGESEKDETELELEKLVFGDKAGFREELRAFDHRTGLQGREEVEPDRDEQDDENALATVDDADLFFLDSGGSIPNEYQITSAEAGEDDGSSLWPKAPPAWEDSDDERMRVSLMSVPRLRKLRRHEGEDVITGREYARRLRKQFETLHPRPEWATWAASNSSAKKRRRRSNSPRTSGDEESSDEDMDADDSESEFTTTPLAKLLRSTEPLLDQSDRAPNKRVKLRAEAIGMERMKDIAPTQPHAITSLAIHPRLPLILSSGLASTLYLHHLRPHPPPPDPANPLITSLQLKNTPLTTTAFSPPTSSSGPKIYLSSRRRYFHTWDLPSGQIRKTTRLYGQQHTQRSFETLKPSPCGRYVAFLGTSRKGGGLVNMVDAETLQWIAQVSVESRKGVADFCWWGDGAGMCVAGKDGEVSEWSVDEGRVVARWQDEGALGTTVIALGGKMGGKKKGDESSSVLGPDRWVVVGSSSGVVNIYDRSRLPRPSRSPAMDEEALPATTSHPTPTKTLDNLTTPISHLVFSPCGQILVMSSRWKRDALRLVHLASCTVYKNWPTGKTPLGRISAVTVGEFEDYDGGGERTMVLLVGNENGALRGWEVRG